MAGILGPTKQMAQGQTPTLPKPPEPPRVVRMPTETDPSILEAQRRTRAAAMRRTGRGSTILTDSLKDTIGSSGQALGA